MDTKIERLKNKVSGAVSTHVAESQTYTDDLFSKLSQGNLNARELLQANAYEPLQQTALKRSGQVLTVGAIKAADLAAKGLDIATFGGFSYLMNWVEQGMETLSTFVRQEYFSGRACRDGLWRDRQTKGDTSGVAPGNPDEARTTPIHTGRGLM